MKRVGIFVLVSVAASAAAPNPHVARKPLALETSKTVEQFGGCFVNAQDRASLAWSYIPQSRGGTFSNSGARGTRTSYFLAVLDRGPKREIRLEAASVGSGIDPRVAGAVDQCI